MSLLKNLFATCFLLSVFLITHAQTSNAVSKGVPKSWTGHWQKGTFSLSAFEDYNGKYLGPANEMSVSYVIEENGMAKEYFISNSISYNCRMQILGYREGKLVVDVKQNSFEFRPVSGYYNMLSCMSKTPTKKPYGEKDLYPAYKVHGVFQQASGATTLITKNAAGENALTLKKIN